MDVGVGVRYGGGCSSNPGHFNGESHSIKHHVMPSFNTHLCVYVCVNLLMLVLVSVHGCVVGLCVCVCVCVCVCAFACSVAKIRINKCPSLPNQSSVTTHTEHWQRKRLHPKYLISYSHELFSPNSVGKVS